MFRNEKVPSTDLLSICLRSAIRGRERWDVKAIWRAPDIARELQRELLRHAGVLQVSANPVTGRVLVLYSPETPGLHIGPLIKNSLKGILSRDIPRNSAAKTDSPLFRIFKTTLPERKHLAVPLIQSTVEHSLNVLQDLSLVGILNTARGEGPGFLGVLGLKSLGARLSFMTGLTVLLSGANLWVQYIRRNSWQKLAESTQQQLRTQLITQIQKQDMAFFDSHSTGQLIKLMTEDTGRIRAFVEQAPNEMIQRSVNIAVSSAVLASASPRLAFLVCLPLPLILVSSRYFGRMAAERYARFGEISGRFTESLENSFVGTVDTKSFTAEQQEISRMDDYSARLADASLAAASVSSLQTQVAGGIASASFLLTSGYGAKLAADEKISLGEYIQVVFWFPQLLRSLTGIQHITNLYHSASHSAKELTGVLDSHPKIRSGPVLLPAKTVRGEVVFEDVSFGYNPSFKVLDGVSFHLRPGETLGVVGPTGSGKSTLLRLLLRFYDVDSGRILLDGKDIRELNLQDLRAAVSLVSQDVHLFQGTIRENVVYGQRDASEEQILEAMSDARAADMLEYLPGGLGVDVGERGHRLSGGERQRVAIARSLLKLFKGASILALDEATSHMDNETESAIKQSLRKVASGKSVLMIAHRLSTIRSADRILVIEKGKVVEDGQHEALLAQQGLYASLWRLQNDDPLGERLEVRISGSRDKKM